MEEIRLNMASEMEDKDEFGEREFHCLFQAAMEKNWKEVVNAYEKYSAAHEAILTKSKDTALHVAISCYHPDGKHSRYHLEHIMQMVNAIKKKNNEVMTVLSLMDVKGNTPLHLAAALGSVSLCKCIAASDHRQLIAARNNKQETPFFLAAHHGKLETFLCLHELYNIQEAEFDYALCRRKDGNTILHSAISGEYFRLAYQIISYYPKLVNSVNVEGDSPLHILARKPSAFGSSYRLRSYENIIYQCVHVPKLRKEKYVPDAKEDSSGPKSNTSYPKHYRTCVNLFLLLRKVIFRLIGSGCRIDEENQPKNEKDSEGVHVPKLKKEKYVLAANKDSGGPESNTSYPNNYRTCVDLFLLLRKVIFRLIGSGCRTDKENQPKNEKDSEEEKDKDDLYPANYATCVPFFKFLMMFLLIIFGIGYRKIQKMREKKKRHEHAYEIMNRMIKLEKGYEYDSNGQAPTKNELVKRDLFSLPDTPPENDERKVENGPGAKMKQNPEAGKFFTALQKAAKELNTENNFMLLANENKQINGFKRKETPFLIAAKMGITEMVEKILDKIPVAIYDLDANEKNALLLAIEDRQTKVFHCLLQRNLPEFVFVQVDNEGNGARHLAAKFGPDHPWRLPGVVFQMLGEVIWFKHVKRSLPALRFAHYNNNGETPREIFTATHEKLANEGIEWLIKTSKSCSFVAAIIATVAFTAAVQVPGAFDGETGYPLLQNEPLFKVFSLASVVALCFSLTALVFFLAIITSRCQVWDFKKNLPRKLLMGLSCLFTSIAVVLVSFCAGHFFGLPKNLQYGALAIYAVIALPLSIFAFAQLQLYYDLMRAVIAEVPVRTYKVSYR